MGRSWGIAPLIGAALAAVALIAAPAGTAAEAAAAPTTECSVELGTLEIDSNGADFTIAREGNRIVVARGSEAVACSGPAATVDSIDRVYGTGGDIITLDLRDGALEPGATPEADGSDEIEVRLAVTSPVILLDDRARHVALGEGDDDAIIDLDLDAPGDPRRGRRPDPDPDPLPGEHRAPRRQRRRRDLRRRRLLRPRPAPAPARLRRRRRRPADRPRLGRGPARRRRRQRPSRGRPRRGLPRSAEAAMTGFAPAAARTGSCRARARTAPTAAAVATSSRRTPPATGCATARTWSAARRSAPPARRLLRG